MNLSLHIYSGQIVRGVLELHSADEAERFEKIGFAASACRPMLPTAANTTAMRSYAASVVHSHIAARPFDASAVK